MRKKKELWIETKKLSIFKPKSLIISNNSIEIAKQKLLDSKNFKLCLSQNICPICGKELEVIIWTNNSEFSPETNTILYCINCKKRTETNIDYWH